MLKLQSARSSLIHPCKRNSKVSKKDIDMPGLEVALPGYINPNNPFDESYVVKENNPQ